MMAKIVQQANVFEKSLENEVEHKTSASVHFFP